MVASSLWRNIVDHEPEKQAEMACGIFRGAQSRRRVQRAANFFIWIRHNPLKSPDSTKGIQGNPRNFPWFSLHFLARNSLDSCICGAWSSVQPAKNPGAFAPGLSAPRIGLRSEVTSDADTALETVAVALPGSRNERASVEDRPDKRVRSLLAHGLIHQLEVEVEVGDRVPADIRANEPSEGAGREDAGADAAHAAVHAAPADPADRALKVGIDGRRPVVLQQPADGPRGRGRPRIGQRVEVSVGQKHLLAISVDLPVLTVLRVRQTRIPGCVPGVGASEQDVVACAPNITEPSPVRQVELDAGVDTPTDLVVLRAAGSEGGDPAAGRVEIVVIPHIDVVDHAGDLGLAPALLDMQRADDVGPTLTAIRRGAGNAACEEPGARVIRASTKTAGHVGAAAGGPVCALTLRSDRRREAAAKRSRVGHQERLVEPLLIGREEVVPVVAAADERVERLRLTSRDARPGHIAGVDISERAAGTVEAAPEVRIEIHVPDQWAVSCVRREIKAEIGADVPADLIAIKVPFCWFGSETPIALPVAALKIGKPAAGPSPP